MTNGEEQTALVKGQVKELVQPVRGVPVTGHSVKCHHEAEQSGIVTIGKTGEFSELKYLLIVKEID